MADVSNKERRKAVIDSAEREIGPPTPAIFHILLALVPGERHGYGIMQAIEELTDGETRLGPGTLYRSIQRMEVEGLVEESYRRGAPAREDERRRYYRITPSGRRAAQAEAKRLQALVHAARDLGLLAGPGKVGSSKPARKEPRR